MGAGEEQAGIVKQELGALQVQLVSLAEIVESAFAECIIALMEGDLAAAREVRQEDYKAHNAWLQADRLCVDLLARGGLSLDDVHLVCASIKIALDLKVMADEGVHISQLMRACPAEKFSHGAATDIMPRIAETTQGMLSDTTEALVNHSPIEAQKLFSAYRELNSLNGDLFGRLADETVSDRQSVQTALALVLVGRAITEMGRHVLDLANHVQSVHGEVRPAQGTEP